MARFKGGKHIWVCEVLFRNKQWFPVPEWGSSTVSRRCAKSKLISYWRNLRGNWWRTPNGELDMKKFRFRKYQRVEEGAPAMSTKRKIMKEFMSGFSLGRLAFKYGMTTDEVQVVIRAEMNRKKKGKK